MTVEAPGQVSTNLSLNPALGGCKEIVRLAFFSKGDVMTCKNTFMTKHPKSKRWT